MQTSKPAGPVGVQPDMRRAGFTLVEMMVVIVIIGILATVVLVNVTGHSGKARVNVTQGKLAQMRQQVEMFKVEKSRYPERLEDLVPEYLEEVPLDAWGWGFRYSIPGSNNRPFEIVSHGEDGREGGIDFDADLSSHPMRR